MTILPAACLHEHTRRWLSRLLLVMLCLAPGAPLVAQGSARKSVDNVNIVHTSDPFPALSFLTTDKSEGAFSLVENRMPEVSYIQVPPSASLGYAVEHE